MREKYYFCENFALPVIPSPFPFVIATPRQVGAGSNRVGGGK